MSARALPRAALVELALRRALPGLALALLVGWGALLVAHDWAPRGLAVPDGRDWSRSLARQGVFGGLALWILPLALWSAACTPARWRRGDAEWLGPRATGRGAILLSTFAGTWLAGAALLALAGLAAEQAAGSGTGDERSLRVARELVLEGALLAPDAPRASWNLGSATADLAPGAELQVELAVLPGAGPSGDARLFLSRALDPTQVGLPLERRVHGRGVHALAMPPGAGPLALELERAPVASGASDVRVTGTPALRVGRVRVLEPVASARAATAALVLEAWLLLAAWIALGLGLGAWLSPATAAAGVLALQLLVWARPGVASDLLGAWPGAGLPRALAQVGEGLVPGGAARALPALAVVVVLGLAAARAGMAEWRREA